MSAKWQPFYFGLSVLITIVLSPMKHFLEEIISYENTKTVPLVERRPKLNLNSKQNKKMLRMQPPTTNSMILGKTQQVLH